MNKELSELLQELSQIPGVSGYEHAVRSFLRERYAPYVDEFVEGRVGNLIMIKQGNGSEPRRKVMIATHIDEIGGMVSDIEQGFIRFSGIGYLDRRHLIGQEVTVFGRQPYHGVVASRPPHFKDEDISEYPKIADYIIDVGLPADVVAENVRVGDVIVVNKEAIELTGGIMNGKAMDNRSSVVSSYICLQTLSRLQHEWDVYAVATCQEEVGTIGAETTAYRIEPDIALVVDVTFSKVPGISENNPCEIDKGPVLGIGPNMHPVVTKYLKDIATHLEIPLQSEIISGHSGTDAWYIQVSRHGVPTGLLSLPSRYMHTPIESVSIKDIERTGRLMAHFISSLDESFVDTLIPKDGFEEEV